MTSIGKRAVVACGLAAAVLGGPVVQVTHGQTATKPNIVVLMIDDFDLTSLWTLVATGKMPNLTKYFVQGGTVFSEAFSVNGLGGPSRATFLTGQYAHNHGVTWGFAPRDLTVLNDSSTVATWLKTAGYRTGHVGRYLTGYGWWTDTRIPPGWDDWKTLIDPSSNNTEQYSMTLNGQLVNFGQLSTTLGVQLHQVDVLSSLATDFIRREAPAASPFFLMLTPGVFNPAVEPTYNVCPGADAPHYEPFFNGSIYGASQKPATRHMDTIFGNMTYALPRPPSFNETEIWDKPVWIRYPEEFDEAVIDCLQKRYWRKLEGMLSVDDMIGSVFGELERTGELANTIAVFTGDNGWLDGQHRFSGKGAPYEEAIRIPLIVRPRGPSGPTRLINKMVLNTDIAPTIANWAEATPAHVVDGRSLVPLMANPNPAFWRTIALFEYEGDRDPVADMPLPPTYNAVRTDRTRPTIYVKYPNVLGGFEAEYYDLAVDPYQLNNQFYEPSRQQERARLELFLSALKTCKGVSCQILEAFFSFN